jgi:ABC-type nickel/cobalt efflux system permease component RcnA
MHQHKDRGHHRRSRTILFLLLLILSAATSFAHPMGNFSVNHYSKITIREGSVEVLYLIDMAEIPTFQETRQFTFSRAADDPRASRYLDRQQKLLSEGLSLLSDGQPVRFDMQSRQLTFVDGAGGLPTMKLGFVFRARLELGTGSHQLSYSDNNFPGRSGWKEVVVLGDGVGIVDSSAPSTDRSHELTDYSSDALNSPPQQLTALARFTTSGKQAERAASTPTPFANMVAGSQDKETYKDKDKDLEHLSSASRSPRRRSRPTLLAVHPAANSLAARSVAHSSSPLINPQSVPGLVVGSAVLPVTAPAREQNTPRSRFTEIISTQGRLGLWVLLSAAFIAAGLGALHALEPGHGKTVVAAYLVGSRGTARHAVLLGIVVTASHTAGVFLLGAVTLYASRYIVPEQLYPWLGAISGVSVASLGIFMFLRRWTGENGEHSHTTGDGHSHWFLSRFERTTPAESANNDSSSPPATTERPLSLRGLCMLGITGGMVPCPAALVVLLSAFSLHRIGFGLFLITAFSFGLAAVLVMVGLGMVYTRRFLSARVTGGGPVLGYLPLLSSAFMVALGVGITASAVASMHLGAHLLSGNKLLPFATVVLLGLFLGMRHSTDADHVVAVSTIVSRQGSVRSSATIGLLWGLGHTLTIFFVGSAIIIFGVVIPPRLGLSMEFCVALMLILLGMLNLTGVMSWVTDRFAPLNRGVWSGSQTTAKEKAKVFARVRSLIHQTVAKMGLYQTMRPLVVGLVHGLAGSAAVALLVLSTIRSPLWSTAYLLVFGFGTMVGMILMTAAISVPVIYAGNKFFKLNHHLTILSGLASVAFGMFLVYHIGFVDGLFTAHVNWIPQ